MTAHNILIGFRVNPAQFHAFDRTTNSHRLTVNSAGAFSPAVRINRRLCSWSSEAVRKIPDTNVGVPQMIVSFHIAIPLASVLASVGLG